MEDIEKDELIERCPALVFGPKDWKAVEKSLLGPYAFEWKRSGALALGIISIINHSERANCEVNMDYETGCMELWTKEDICSGTELSIDYGPGYVADWKKDSEA